MAFQLYNLTLIDANTEYKQELRTGIRRFTFQARTSVEIRYSFQSGQVAGSLSPYMTLKAGAVYNSHGVDSRDDLYLASSVAGVEIEIETA